MILLAIGLSVLYYFQYIEIRADYEMDKYILNDQSQSYNLFSPQIKYELPNELIEISGLSYLREDKLSCVQDEEGILYIYDLLREDISRKIEFENKGDFEGVEVIDEDIFVLRSDGDLFRFALGAEDSVEPVKLDTDLSSKNDTEGLGYLAEQNTLLIACKESGDSKEVDVRGKAIYQYDIQDNHFLEKAFINFSDDYIEESLEQFGLKKKHAPFKPSAIASHPKTGSIYILSSTAKLLIVCDIRGIIRSMIPLDEGIFSQPEGICFSPDGKMYISNEGKGGKGYILVFPFEKIN